MATIIVSYDGTDSDKDALALGHLLAGAGASLELAYVRHATEQESEREQLAGHEAEALLRAGAESVGLPEAPQHVVFSGSSAEGLRQLALERGADVIVFGSAYRTAKGHVDPQATARRLLDGGPVAIALAPAGFAAQDENPLRAVAAISEDGDPCAHETAETLARQLGAEVVDSPGRNADLLVLGSKPGTVNGRVTISAAADYLIELAGRPALILPRGVSILFAGGGG
jgi:nucleotide-binding universal stress UspA family protein